MTAVYAASPIPPLDAVQSYFETHECGYTQRLLTVYKAEVAEVYTRLYQRLSTVVQRFWYVFFDEVWQRNNDIREVDRNFDVMDVLEDSALAWTVRAHHTLMSQLHRTLTATPMSASTATEAA